MKTIFDRADCEELMGRMDRLGPGTARQWGKMSPSQMLEHCARALEVATGQTTVKQWWLGRLISWRFRKDFLGQKPFPKDSPTMPALIIQDEPEFQGGAARVRALMRQLQSQGERGSDGRVHFFFGRMTGAEWGVTQYKHLDHHFRQFGV